MLYFFKVIFIFMLIFRADYSIAQSPEFLGVLKGSAASYFDLKVTKFDYVRNSATSGVEGDIVDRISRNEDALLKGLKQYGLSFCKNHKSLLIDSLEYDHEVFGSVHNILTSMSANVICISN